MLNGTKAPVAAMFSGAVGITWVISFFSDRNKFKQVSKYLFITCVIFISIYIYLHLDLVESKTMSPRIVIGSLFKESTEINQPFSLPKFITDLIKYSMYLPFFLLLFLPFGSTLFLSSYKKIISRSFWKLENIFFFSFIFLGLVMTFGIYLPLGANTYFIAIAVPFINYFGLQYLFEKSKHLNIWHKRIINLSLVVSILSTGFALGRQFIKGGFGILNVVQEKSECNPDDSRKNSFIEKLLPSQNCPGWNKITSYEYAGMRWLKENTPKDAVILNDRFYYAPPIPPVQRFARYFYYSAFSQRNLFLEGYFYWIPSRFSTERMEFVKEIYRNPEQLIGEIRNNNIEYVLVSRFIQPELKIESNNFELVFTNRDIDIYKVN
jgi:hypothetical protein